VNEDLAAEVVAIFDQLLQLRYPIEKIRTVETYPGADDELSKEYNSSAFDCRDIPGTAGLSTLPVEPSTSTRCSIRRSIEPARVNPRTLRHTSTATAQIPDS
jgi:hypothetical protein